MNYKRLSLTVIMLLSLVTYAQSQNEGVLNHSIYLQHDNDIFRLKNKTDQYYSFGILTGYFKTLEKESELRKVLFFTKNPENEKLILGFEYFLKGYTPEFKINENEENKRPFAGTSIIKTTLQSSSKNRLISFSIELGVRGPLSGAEWVQDNFHRMIGDEVFEGWDSQLPNKFLYNLKTAYTKGFFILNWLDISSNTELALGNSQTHLEQRMTTRLGLLSPISESVMYRNHLGAKQPLLELFFYFSAIGKLVGVDTTFGKFDDSDISNPVNKSNVLAGYETGIQFQKSRLGIYLAHHRVSSESNFSTKHSYGSMAVSYSF